MLLSAHRRDNARVAHAFGVEYPSWFVNPAAEYQSLTRYAGALDLTHWSILRATGKDRVSFLNAMLTADVSTLDTHRGCHALLTTIKGKIIAEMFVFVREDDVLLLVSQGDVTEAKAVLEKHIIMEDVTLADASEAFGIIALEGVKLDDAMWRFFEKGPFPKEHLQAFPRRFGDIDVYVMRNNVTGMGGYHMLMPSAAVERMWTYVLQGIRGTDGLPVGSIAWNMCRVEHGLPWYGVDFSDDNFPDECRLGQTISYTKGCFRGQETLARLHHRGHVNRVLAGLVPVQAPSEATALANAFGADINNYDEPALQAAAAALAGKLDLSTLYPGGTELFAAGDPSKPVGHVTSAVFSPRLGRPLLLGYLRREILDAGDPVNTGNGTSLDVIDLPLQRD